MTPELQKQLAEYLKALMDVGAKAGNFAADQLPLIVQEKILYGRVSETLQLLIFLAIVYASYKGFRWGIRAENNRGFGELGIPAAIASGIIGVLFIIFTMIQTSYVAMVWFAPRLYIIEWASQLATGK